ncbi:MAG: hypothetical protein ABFR90_11445 [Planctomycetota bacterium]
MEIATALVILSVMLGSVIVLMNRYVEAVMDMQLRDQAFELARGNMESLLSEPKLSDMSDYGTSETNPDIEWETTVEPFYEPITDRMWIHAICSAGFTDSKGEFENIELEHWITSLTAAQIKQVLAQQEIEDEYMALLAGDEDSAIQETTRAYLEEQGLDVEAYDKFIRQQRREKLEHIAEKGFDGYEKFVEKLKDEESEFLEELGMNFDGYNDFAAGYVPKGADEDSLLAGLQDDPYDSGSAGVDPSPNDRTPDTKPKTDSSGIDWDRIPKEFWPIFEGLGLNPPE